VIPKTNWQIIIYKPKKWNCGDISLNLSISVGDMGNERGQLLVIYDKFMKAV
jgi:hypothetical protein